jgi:hypothetical protein
MLDAPDGIEAERFELIRELEILEKHLMVLLQLVIVLNENSATDFHLDAPSVFVRQPSRYQREISNCSVLAGKGGAVRIAQAGAL